MAGLRLRDVAKGTCAVRAVPLRLANAEAPTPGQPPSEASATIKVGVRVLLGDETAQVYEKAQALAAEKGVSTWNDEHPLCRLYEMTLAIFFAVVSVDQETGLPVLGEDGEPVAFFDSPEQIGTSKSIGTDNIAYLHEQWIRWQDACSIRVKKLGMEEAMAAVLLDMEAPDSPESPLLSMGHASLVSCLRFMGKLLFGSPKDKSSSGSPAEQSSSSISRSLLVSGLKADEGTS
jgi:hypothetical protein